MNATATLIPGNDTTQTDTRDDGTYQIVRLNWYEVKFDDGEVGQFGFGEDGVMLDADGCPVDDFGNARNIAARSAIRRAQ